MVCRTSTRNSGFYVTTLSAYSTSFFKQVHPRFKMEDKVLIFEEAKIIFQNIDFQRSSSVPKAFEELRYCAGQLIHFNVEIPVSKDALQNVKVPHPARSPASSNLLRCFMRHLASTVDVKTSISVHHRAVSISTKDLAHETTVWFSCLLETSQLHDIYAGFFVSAILPVRI